MASSTPPNGQDSEARHELHPAPLEVLTQFIKDLSFENPNPEISFAENKDAPDISLNLDIQVHPLKESEKTFEVVLHLKAEAKRPAHTLFIAELQYAGIFKIGSIPEDALHPILMIECPRMLFPWARQIIANVTREGGFPTLNLAPIDFVELYRKQYVEPHQKEQDAKIATTGS